MANAENRRQELEEMTKAQLVAVGLEHNVELDPDAKKGAMIDQVLKLEGYKASEAAPTESSARADERARDLPPTHRLFEMPVESFDDNGKRIVIPGKQWKGRMFRLKISHVEGETGDVPVTVNGYCYQIKRGVEVTVPEPVIRALESATVETVQHNPDTNQVTPVSYQRYPFSASPV